MNHNLEIQKILLEIDKLTRSEDKIKRLKDAIRIADANNDLSWGFELREDLCYEETKLSSANESFVAFAWMLNTYDTSPDLFNLVSLLYLYRLMIIHSYDYSSIAKNQIHAMKDDYINRLIDNGYSRRSYYDLEVDWSLFIGNVKRAREYLYYRNTEPIDQMTSGQETIANICIELLDNKIEKGITLAKEYLNEDNTQKVAINSILIYYLSKHPEKKEITKICIEEVEYEFSKKQIEKEDLFYISQIMYFLSKYDVEKAWIFFEKYSHWVDQNINDFLQFDFSLAILPLFSQEHEATKILDLNANHPLYKNNSIYKIEDFYIYYKEIVDRLSIAFDNRNENTYFKQQIARHLGN